MRYGKVDEDLIDNFHLIVPFDGIPLLYVETSKNCFQAQGTCKGIYLRHHPIVYVEGHGRDTDRFAFKSVFADNIAIYHHTYPCLTWFAPNPIPNSMNYCDLSTTPSLN